MDFYNDLIPEIESMFTGESDKIANLANVSSVLYYKLNERAENTTSWCGFYFFQGDTMILGPFQGRIACTRIKAGKGVCGKAAETKETQIVEDVHQFPGHIACDSRSNSEIVIPLIKDGNCVGVLDLDSEKFNTFNLDDKEGLERIGKLIVKYCC